MHIPAGARALRLPALLLLPLLGWWHSPPPEPAFDRATNGLWVSRHALYGTGKRPVEALVAGLRAHGITRIYPFLGPPDSAGTPGWRDGRRHRPYRPDAAAAFLGAMGRLAPEVAVLPWSGGVWNEQIFLDDPQQRDRLFEHYRTLVAAGAAGIHLNVEPLPSGHEPFIAWLRALRRAVPEAQISVAAYPPPWLWRGPSPVNWSLAYDQRLCAVADELVFMAYDTGLRVGRLYEALVARWTAQLADALAGGPCRWSMGVPSYEDDEPWHAPQAETLRRALRGVRRGLPQPPPAEFTGVSVYAAWTTDAAEWRRFATAWRGRALAPKQ